ncbi:MAG: hypothetical protein AAGD15_16270 [Agrobacterium cavarae]|uniref:hypothetical protein n=1 Tax=Agrobacterium cavarae TaxID=2528239 RepID=UPI0031B42187
MSFSTSRQIQAAQKRMLFAKRFLARGVEFGQSFYSGSDGSLGDRLVLPGFHISINQRELVFQSLFVIGAVTFLLLWHFELDPESST